MTTELTFLGSSGYFPSENNFHSNMMLSTPSGSNLLIDCGSDIRHSIAASKFEWEDISGVYISNLYNDHTGGLEALSLYSYLNNKRPYLIAHESIMESLWMDKIGITLMTQIQSTKEFADYFKLKSIKNAFTWEGIKLKVVPAINIVNEELGHMYSFGLFLDVDGYKIYITSDLSYTEYEIKESDWNINKHWFNYENADIIFHDCETDENPSLMHTHYDFLTEFPDHIKNKMWLYHYSNATGKKPKNDGFAGFVKKGQTFKLKQIE